MKRRHAPTHNKDITAAVKLKPGRPAAKMDVSLQHRLSLIFNLPASLHQLVPRIALLLSLLAPSRSFDNSALGRRLRAARSSNRLGQ
jgi:hypothetical protein